MTLDDFTSSDSQQEGINRKPKKFTRDDFEEVLEETSHSWERKDFDWTKEWIYETESEKGRFIMRIYSSVDKRDNKARDTGDDAIRLVVLEKQTTKPVIKEKRTNRVPTWPKNLKKKIKNIENRKNEVKICSKCTAVMVIQRNKESGNKFYGCSSYPHCENTESLE